MCPNSPRRNPFVLKLTLGLCLLAPVALRSQEQQAAEQPAAPAAAAETAPVPALDADQIPELLGEWVLLMESPQGSFESDLVIQDIDGKAIAEFSVPQQDSRTITDIARTETGALLTFRTEFAGQLFTVNLDIARDGDGLAGTLGDDAGLFSIPFEGLTKQNAIALEQTTDSEEGASRRSRRGSSGESELTFAGQSIRVRFDRYKISEPDYEQITAPQSGEVVTFIKGRPTKFWTDADLQFGDTVVATHNVAPDYPGVYSLWLKPQGDGWFLVVNELADVWGTQHDPDRDVAEIPLEVQTSGTVVEELEVVLEEAEDGGLLRISWGSQEWSTHFTVNESP